MLILLWNQRVVRESFPRDSRMYPRLSWISPRTYRFSPCDSRRRGVIPRQGEFSTSLKLVFPRLFLLLPLPFPL